MRWARPSASARSSSRSWRPRVGEGFLEPLELVGPYPERSAGDLHRPVRAGRRLGGHDRRGRGRRLRPAQYRPARARRRRRLGHRGQSRPADRKRLRALPSGRRARLRLQHVDIGGGAGSAGPMRSRRSSTGPDTCTSWARCSRIPGAWEIIERAAAVIKGRGGSISLDPNLRKELKDDGETERAVRRDRRDVGPAPPLGRRARARSRRRRRGRGASELFGRRHRARWC